MGGRLLSLLLYCEGVERVWVGDCCRYCCIVRANEEGINIIDTVCRTGVGGRLLMDNLQGCVGRGHDNSCCI